MKRLTQKVWNAHQSWYYESLILLEDGTKVKVQIRRNAYDFQSFAQVSFFDQTTFKWREVAETPHPQMKCLNISYVQRGITAKDFEEDEALLLSEARHLIP